VNMTDGPLDSGGRLADAVRDRLGDLFPCERFRVEESTTGLLVLQSTDLECRFTLSPRGEFEVTVAPRGTASWKGWVYAGLVGRTDLRRLLEIAGEEVRAEPRILAADPGYYADLARQREQEQAEYNRGATAKGADPNVGTSPSRG